MRVSPERSNSLKGTFETRKLARRHSTETRKGEKGYTDNNTSTNPKHSTRTNYMKTTFISVAAALMIAGPAFAERENHSYPGEVSGNAQTASEAIAHFAASEQGDGAYRRGEAADMGVIVSTSNAGNADFAAAKLDNGEHGDN
jgi:hypothetical protein